MVGFCRPSGWNANVQRATKTQLLAIRWSTLSGIRLFREYPGRNSSDNLALEPIESVISKGLAGVTAILAALE